MDHTRAGRCSIRLGDLPMEIYIFLVQPVEHQAAVPLAPESDVGRDIDYQGDVRHDTGYGRLIGHVNQRTIDSPGSALVHFGRHGEPVGDDHFTFRQRGFDHPSDQVGTRSQEQKEFRDRGHFMFRVEESQSDSLGDRRAPGLSHPNRVDTALEHSL